MWRLNRFLYACWSGRRLLACTELAGSVQIANPTLASQRFQNGVQTSFVSQWPLDDIQRGVLTAFAHLQIDAQSQPLPAKPGEPVPPGFQVLIKIRDNRGQPLIGRLRVEDGAKFAEARGDAMDCDGPEWAISFMKESGDVLGWKRIYKRLLDTVPAGMIVAR